ncbi:MAG: hypothetical protein JWM11_6183 [Planctomycetaceae bacterium]|nr:hypothetical protein [Planctomycetaceae bacterium]
MKTSARSLKGWEKTYRRWSWEIKGKRTKVTCEELGLPESEWTQEGSRAAAWDRYKQLTNQIALEEAASHPLATEIAVLSERHKIAQLLGKPDAADLAAMVQQLETNPDQVLRDQAKYQDGNPEGELAVLDIGVRERIELAALLEIKLPNLNAYALNALFGSDRFDDRKHQVENLDTSKTIGEAVKRYLDGKISDARLGNRSAGGVDNIRRYLAEFLKVVGDAAGFQVITFTRWEEWQRYCQHHRREYWKSVYNTSKTFLSWCTQQELVELPKNFHNKITFTFEKPEIKTYDDTTIIKILKAATGNLKLCLLLMLNCGMQSKDISDLKKSEIDFKAGTIRRKRSKTKDKPNTPTVIYPLWRTTLELLKECLNQDPDCALALTTKSGLKWNFREIREDGTLKRSDNINTLWQHLEKKIGKIGRLGMLKKSSASKLRNNLEHADCRIMFLGHSDRTVADQHYAAITPQRLAKAVKWLGDEWRQN